MSHFPMAYGCDHSADAALQALSQSLPVPSKPAPGLVYLNQQASPHAEHILQTLRAKYPTVQWSGACGYSVVAGALELTDMPAISAMILPLPPNSWHEFSGQSPIDKSAHTALVHADPAAPDLPALVSELANRTQTGYLFGGLTCGEPARAEQFCNGASLSGGLSGISFGEQVKLLSRVTQGCSPLASEHVITGVQGNYVKTLDNEPALDVVLRDLGIDEQTRRSTDGETLLRAMPNDLLRGGLLVGLNDSAQDQANGFGDYLVRNLIGIDPENRLIAIGAEPAAQDRLVLCTRDRNAARADLIRVCTELREQVESESLRINGAHFVSCVARGQSLFGTPGAEIALLRHNLGDVPLTGFYANGEIARERLYGYTGVLSLFVEPA